MQQIADQLNCSMQTVHYWMKHYGIERRTISEAVYSRHNPQGDPFKQKDITTLKDAELYGMGIGLYWGEGTKANKYAVRLGNSDPLLLQVFMKFLTDLFAVNKSALRFGLQLFSDIDPAEALQYWTSKLGINASQFYKPHITPSGSLGTYKKKSRYGVVTIYYHNKKLRDIIVGQLPR